MLQETLIAVQKAAASGDSERLDLIEKELRIVCDNIRVRLSTGEETAIEQAESWLESARRTALLLSSAGEFYSGLTAVMKMQLHGYGRVGSGGPVQPGSRFAIEG
jgi:hypothetical protein